MSSVNIVFWTGTGNTAAMAEAVAQGVKEAGAEAELISVDKVNVAELVRESGEPDIRNIAAEILEIKRDIQAIKNLLER